jgi:hypothetical protein
MYPCQPAVCHLMSSVPNASVPGVYLAGEGVPMTDIVPVPDSGERPDLQFVEAAGANVDDAEDHTWIGKEASATAPAPSERTGSEISLRDQMDLREQRQRHILQLAAAGGIALMILAVLVITLSFGAAHAITQQTVEDIIHSLIAPMVVSGMIAIIAWLFNNTSK